MRTAEALAAKRSAGLRIGRPRACPDSVLERVIRLRAGGATLKGIAGELNHDAVPTPGGGPRWHPSHVSRLLQTQDARTLLHACDTPAISVTPAAR